MKPYWQQVDCAIYLGDCLEIMPTLEASSVGLLVADPPYFRVKDEWWDRQWDTPEGFLAWVGRLCGEWGRLLKANGSLYCFASPQMGARVEVKIAETFNVLSRVTWRKEEGIHWRQHEPSLRCYFPQTEAIIFAEKYGVDHAADDEAGYGLQCRDLHKQVYAPIGAAVQKKRQAAGLQRHQVDSACSPSRKPTGLCYRWEEGACLPTLEQWIALCRLCGDIREYEDPRREYEDLRREYEDLRRPFFLTADVPYTDVWDFPTVQDFPGKHPCEKPLAMLYHMVQASSRPGDLVLDPCCGSGTTLEAARNLGRRCLGIEVEERWAERAARRLEQGVLQFSKERPRGR